MQTQMQVAVETGTRARGSKTCSGRLRMDGRGVLVALHSIRSIAARHLKKGITVTVLPRKAQRDE